MSMERELEMGIRSALFPFGLHYLTMVGGFVKISKRWENDFSSSVAGWTCRGQVARVMWVVNINNREAV